MTLEDLKKGIAKQEILVQSLGEESKMLRQEYNTAEDEYEEEFTNLNKMYKLLKKLEEKE